MGRNRIGDVLAVASFSFHLGWVLAQSSSTVVVSGTPPANASAPIPEAFVSYSIEFAFFPDFAGNTSSPNTFSDNLLNNLRDLQGTKPYIRVGGNTQDYALYNASLKEATYGIVDPKRSPDYPTTLHIGPSYFDSYNTWPNTKFVHGFNLGLGGNNSAGWQTLLDTVPLACKALGKDKLLMWEYGNEPDLFPTSAQGAVRPPGWHESTFVAEWLNGTRAIKAQLAKYCPELLSNETYGYMAPSFAGTNNRLKWWNTWKDGISQDGNIKLISSHNYIGGSTQPGVTLQGTLMNHSSTVRSISSQVNESTHLANYSIPFILGETNSLYNEGAPGLSNAFGAALWGLDFNLWCASVGIRRVHMHEGLDYRYAAWQPRQTEKTSIGTKPPYYGQVAVAAFLGNLTDGNVQVANLKLDDGPFEAAYVAYVDKQLTRIAVINMRQYNYTINGTSTVPNPVKRPSKSYSFKVPMGLGRFAKVQRLHANGSDAITGVSWDGWSYNWELDHGKPVRLGNFTKGEAVRIKSNVVTIDVEDSSASVLNFEAS